MKIEIHLLNVNNNFFQVTTLEISNRVLSQHMRYVKYLLYILLLVCLFAVGFFWAVFYHK